MGNPLRFAIDAAAAAILGSAVCFAVFSVFQVTPLVALSIGGLAFVRVFASLVRLPAVVPAIERFELAPLIFHCDPHALLPDDLVAADEDGSRIVRLFGSAPHPGNGTNQALPDATEQLREALAQLRGAAG